MLSGRSRSQTGAEAWATIASMMATADHEKLGVYDATMKLITEYWESLLR